MKPGCDWTGIFDTLEPLKAKNKTVQEVACIYHIEL